MAIAISIDILIVWELQVARLIRVLIAPNPAERPSAREVLRSELLPPTVGDQQLSDLLRSLPDKCGTSGPTYGSFKERPIRPDQPVLFNWATDALVQHCTCVSMQHSPNICVSLLASFHHENIAN